MKVKSLIELLSTFDPELNVWLSRDPEGNGFAKLTGYSSDLSVDTQEMYYNRTESVFSPEDLDEKRQEAEEWGEDFDPYQYQPVIVLWP